MSSEERELMVFASERLAEGMDVCLRLSVEQPPRPWAEQVLPYGLAEMMLITPSRWTLTEVSREVRPARFVATRTRPPASARPLV